MFRIVLNSTLDRHQYAVAELRDERNRYLAEKCGLELDLRRCERRAEATAQLCLDEKSAQRDLEEQLATANRTIDSLQDVLARKTEETDDLRERVKDFASIQSDLELEVAAKEAKVASIVKIADDQMDALDRWSEQSHKQLETIREIESSLEAMFLRKERAEILLGELVQVFDSTHSSVAQTHKEFTDKRHTMKSARAFLAGNPKPESVKRPEDCEVF